ncbi:MAG: peptidoglycan editing factor PgeF [Bacteroidia bacterium]
MILKPSVFHHPHLLAVQSGRYFPAIEGTDFSADRDLFLMEIGLNIETLVYAKQVHGNKVLVADTPVYKEGYDAIVTNVPGVYACVSVADCTPVLIYDTKQKAVAAIHAGWRGTVANIVVETLQTMQAYYGTKGEDCLAFIGACISERNFEVGDEVAEQFAGMEKRYDAEKGKYFVDLKLANKHQLLNCGLHEKNIEVSDFCTVADNARFYSYRKEKGKTGRLFALIGMNLSA